MKGRTKGQKAITAGITPGALQIPPQYSKILTKSDRQFLECYATCATIREVGRKWAAMRGASLSETSEKADAYQKLRTIKEKIAAAGNPEAFWEFMGLGANRIAKALSDGLGATMVRPMLARRARVVPYLTASGKPAEKVVEEEELIEAGPYADHPTRIDAAMSAAKLRGDIARPMASVDNDGGSGPPIIRINITQYNTQINQGDNGGNGRCLPVN
jgi:nucleotide-binding universal stress UspA family protein